MRTKTDLSNSNFFRDQKSSTIGKILSWIALTAIFVGCRSEEATPSIECNLEESFVMFPDMVSPGDTFVAQLEQSLMHNSCDIDWSEVVSIQSKDSTMVEICDSHTLLYQGMLFNIQVNEKISVGEEIDLVLNMKDGSSIEILSAFQIIQDAQLGSAERNLDNFCEACN